jgi:hypothetical protein
MSKKGALRKISFEEAKEEDLERFLKLSYADRWRALEALRRLNYGEDVLKPMKKTITIISRNNKLIN